MNENRGEGRGGFKLLVTNRVDRVEFVKTKITTLCQTFSLFIVCLMHLRLKSKNDGLVLHNFLENVFK